MKKMAILTLTLALLFGVNAPSQAKNDKDKSLPPGLQKKVDRGQSLPPGWQKKLAVGEILDADVYRHGRVISRDHKGHVTMGIENKMIKVIENTREIVEILNDLK